MVGRNSLDLHVLPDPEVLCTAVATRISSAAERVHGRSYQLALTGGRTARRLYAILSRYPVARWSSLECWGSDERLVDPVGPLSNARSAWEVWLSHLDLSDERIHMPEVALADASEVARRYEAELRTHLGGGLALDCVLLSLGDDGHVASLFPGRTDLGEDGRLVIPVVDSPTPPSRRVTMTLGMINRAKRMHVLVAGPGKADALAATMHAVRRGEPDIVQWPATGIRVEHERVEWWADRAAAGRLGQ